MPKGYPSQDMPHLGQRIKEARRAAGLTQVQLAKLMRVTQDDVSRFEIRHAPRDATIQRVADALKIPFEQLKPWRPVKHTRREWQGLIYLAPGLSGPGKLRSRIYLGSQRALDAIRDAGQTPTEFLIRHTAGDWGEMTPEAAARNDAAIGTGAQIVSRYTTHADAKLLIVTDAADVEIGERDRTRIILPEEDIS